ncbi:MAG: AraC family transcriptional regulator [Lentisphaeraceae bacterium]|nr:AraC family transcriptional regulator [Lentisphaeraceae bacterium]
MDKTDLVKYRSTFLSGLNDDLNLALFDYMLDIQYWMKDKEGRYVHVNQGLLKNYALTSLEQIIGKTDFDLSPDYIASRHLAGDQQVMNEGKIIANHVELVGQYDGIVNWYSTTKMPLRNGQGEIVGTAGFNHELSSGQVSQAIYGEMGSIIHYIKENMQKSITVGELAEKACLSVSALERQFKKRFKMPPLQYVKRLRLNMACELLMTTDDSISEIALDCGFCDHSYMTKIFTKTIGMSPRQYRQKYWGSNIDESNNTYFI